MGQSINDIRHLLDLAALLRRGAMETEQPQYSGKLLAAALDLDNRAEELSKRDGYALI